MKRSLRRSLLVSTGLGTAVVLAVAGAILYVLMRAWLWSEFDRSLTDKARMLVSAVEVEGAKVELEADVKLLPEFNSSQRPEYFEVRGSGGRTLLASRSLAGGRLGADVWPASDSPVRAEPVLLPDGRAGRMVLVQFVPLQKKQRPPGGPEPLVLAVARETAPIQGALARLRALLAVVGATAVAVCLGVLFLAVRRGIRPIQQLANQIARMKDRELSCRVVLPAAPVELAPVAERLNELLAARETSFEREKSFTADVAHELRTPLAGLRSVLEVTAARPRTPEQYHSALGECLAISRHLQGMVDNLLYLARLDAGQVKVAEEDVDLTAVIEECWRPFGQAASHRGLRVESTVERPTRARTDRSILGLILQNLFDNAVSHADAGGWVAISAAASDGAAVIEVRNSGSVISAEELPRVFDRFWRKDPARAQTGRHCGLGLSVVRKAAEALGVSLEARSDRGGEFAVTLRLPVEPEKAAPPHLEE